MDTLQLSSFGEPAEVVELAEIASADPGPGQLAVAIEAAPINPSDLMLIKGVYGVRPELPAALHQKHHGDNKNRRDYKNDQCRVAHLVTLGALPPDPLLVTLVRLASAERHFGAHNYCYLVT